MKEFFSIGEVSKLFNVKISALRYYDEIGLLKPEYKDEQTNYRYYSTQQFERLDTIKYLRALGLPINKLAFLFWTAGAKACKDSSYPSLKNPDGYPALKNVR